MRRAVYATIVLLLRYCFEMFRIYAATISAQMIYVKSFWNTAVKFNVCKAVDKHPRTIQFAGMSKYGISSRCLVIGPDPTTPEFWTMRRHRTSFIDFRPESFGNRHFVFHTFDDISGGVK